VLSDVESYIQERPDSALAVLRGIDKKTLGSRRLQAQYSLLEAAALYKNYIDTTDLGIIEPAVDYYSRHGSADEKLKALYYQGVLYLQGESFDKAIVSLSKAEELIPNAKDKRYIGLLYSAISDTFNKTHNSVEELRYIYLAQTAFSEAGLSQYYHTTQWRIAQALNNNRQYAEAEEIYKALLADSDTPISIVNNIKEEYAQLLIVLNNDNCQHSLELFDSILADGSGFSSVRIWASYAYVLAVCGRSDESDDVFNQLYAMEQNDYSVIDIWKSAAYETEGDYRNAYSLLQKSLSYQDSLLNMSISQATVRSQRDYLSIEKSQLEIVNKNNRIKALIAIFLLILLSMALYIFFRNKNIKLEKERVAMAEIAESIGARLKESEECWALERISFEEMVNTQQNEISTLYEQIDKGETTLSRLRSEYTRMYKTQFKYLGELSETYLLANKRTDSQKVVYNKVKDLIKDISGDMSGQRHFEQMIDRSLGGIMAHFREDFPSYTEEDYRFVSYLIVGFDATTISIILNMPSVAAVYMKKSRIKKTIVDSKSLSRDILLEMIV